MTGYKSPWGAVCLVLTAMSGTPLPAQEAAPWSTWTPRPEVSPQFELAESEGDAGPRRLILRGGDAAGAVGCWRRSWPVAGGEHYRIQVARRTTDVEHPDRCGVVRLVWLGEDGQTVLRDEPSQASFREGQPPQALPEFPQRRDDLADGWTTFDSIYRAPSTAHRAQIELWFRWDEDGVVEWSEPVWERSAAPSPRLVRLAAVHFQPRAGTTAAEKAAQFAPLIEQAARRRADLVVLPETLTYYGSGRSYAECAEPIPGPSTAYFGELAARHGLHLVVGLLERDKTLVYNVAVLIGPDGAVLGKYRKVALPRGEIEAGITPGDEYPVFDTPLGKIGMMVCYDGFFPEVARQLSQRGAEIIAWPVWGCNPRLAEARACENHVFLVSSTYTDASEQWTRTAVYGRDGRPLRQAESWGEVIVAEVDLNSRLYWASLGDFRGQLPSHTPPLARDR